MKKIGFISAILIISIAVLLFINKAHYPSLPIEELSAKEAIQRLKASDHKIVEIAVEDKAIWYMTKTGDGGMAAADEQIKQLIGSNGWEFTEKDGSGLFFEKDGETLIATTQMWTKKYVLVKVPTKFKAL